MYMHMQKHMSSICLSVYFDELMYSNTVVLQNVSSLQDDQVLTTLDPEGNLTVYQNGSQTFLD